MSVQSASFAVLKSGTNQLFKVTGEWIAEYCKESDLFTVCRVNFEGDPVNHWVRFEDIYDKLEDDDWLVCTDTDGVTYKVSGKEFYNTKDPLRFIKIKNPVISWTSPQPGGVMSVEKHTTTINGTAPITHEGSWGYRDNGGVGPTEEAHETGYEKDMIRGFAFQPHTGVGLATINGSKNHYGGGDFLLTFDGGKEWDEVHAQVITDANQTDYYAHEVFWLAREHKFAAPSPGSSTDFFVIEVNPDDEANPIEAELIKLKDKSPERQDTAWASFIDDDLSYMSGSIYLSSAPMDKKTGYSISIKKDPLESWASVSGDSSKFISLITQNTVAEWIGYDSGYRAERYGDWFYFYHDSCLRKISISQTRAEGKVTAYPVMRCADTPYAMVKLPFLDRPSMLIAGGVAMPDGGSDLETKTHQWVHVIELDDKTGPAKRVHTPTEHSFTSRIRASCGINADAEVAMSDYNGNISITSDGKNFEFVSSNFPDDRGYQVRALGFNEASGTKVEAGLHIAGTKGLVHKGTLGEAAGYDLIENATNPASYTLQQSDLNKSIGWIETTSEGGGRSVNGASSPSPKINLYGQASDIKLTPEILNSSFDNKFTFNTGVLTDENMNLGAVFCQYRLNGWDSKGWKNTCNKGVKQNYGYANSAGWCFGDPSIAWPVRVGDKICETISSDKEANWGFIPTSDNHKIIILVKVYRAQFRRSIAIVNNKLINHNAVASNCCVRAIEKAGNRSDAMLKEHWDHSKPSATHRDGFTTGPFEAVVLDVPINTTIVDSESDLSSTAADGDIAIISLICADENAQPAIYEFSSGGWNQLDSASADEWIQSNRLDLKPIVFDGYSPEGSHFNVATYRMVGLQDTNRWREVLGQISGTGKEITAQGRKGVNNEQLALICGTSVQSNQFIGNGFSVSVNFKVQGKSYTANSSMYSAKSQGKPVTRPIKRGDNNGALIQKTIIGDLATVDLAPIGFQFPLNNDPYAIKSTLEYCRYDTSLIDLTSTWRPISQSLLNTGTLASNSEALKYGVWRDELNNPVLRRDMGTVLVNTLGTEIEDQDVPYLNEFKEAKKTNNNFKNSFNELGDRLCNNPVKALNGIEILSSGHRNQSSYYIDIFEYDPNKTNEYVVTCPSFDYEGYPQSSHWEGNGFLIKRVDTMANLPVNIQQGHCGMANCNAGGGRDALACHFMFSQGAVRSGMKWNHYGELDMIAFKLVGGVIKSDPRKITVSSMAKSRQDTADIEPLAIMHTAAVYSSNKLRGYYINQNNNPRYFAVGHPDYNDATRESNITLDGVTLPTKAVVLAAYLCDDTIVAVIEKDTGIEFNDAPSYFNSRSWLALPKDVGGASVKPSYILATATFDKPGEFTTVALPAGWSDFSVYSFSKWPEEIRISNGSSVMGASFADWSWTDVEPDLTASLTSGQEIIHYTPRTERVHGYAGLAVPGDTELTHVSTLPNVIAGPKITETKSVSTTTIGELWEKQTVTIPSDWIIKSLVIEENP